MQAPALYFETGETVGQQWNYPPLDIYEKLYHRFHYRSVFVLYYHRALKAFVLTSRISLFVILFHCYALPTISIIFNPDKHEEIFNMPMCFDATTRGDHSVKGIEDCKAAIAMIPSPHHPMDTFRPSVPVRGNSLRHRSGVQVLGLERNYTPPAAFRAGGCLVLIAASIYDNTPFHLQDPNPRVWMHWLAIKKAAQHVLSRCDLTNRNQNIGTILARVPLLNNHFFDYWIRIRGVPPGGQSPFSEEEGSTVSFEPPFFERCNL